MIGRTNVSELCNPPECATQDADTLARASRSGVQYCLQILNLMIHSLFPAKDAAILVPGPDLVLNSYMSLLRGENPLATSILAAIGLLRMSAIKCRKN